MRALVSQRTRFEPEKMILISTDAVQLSIKTLSIGGPNIAPDFLPHHRSIDNVIAALQRFVAVRRVSKDLFLEAEGADIGVRDTGVSLMQCS